jgi:hypothetical protein
VLIDGRNRLKACEMAGVEPTFVRLNGEDPAAYILSANVERRSLTAGQKAMARALASPEAKRTGRAGGIVKSLNNSDRVMLSQARIIVRWLGEAAGLLVLAGAKPFDEALKEATAARDKQASDEAQMARLRNEAPDLAELVTEGRMSLSEAHAALGDPSKPSHKRLRAHVDENWRH